MRRTHTCGELREEDIGKIVILCGWVDSIRLHGKVVFINLRDRYGITQIVVREPQIIEEAKKLGSEYVISVRGKVFARPPEAINPNLSTGKIEVEAQGVEILSKAKPPVFEISDRVEAKHELRLQYRYLDLRRPSMTANIMFKSKLYYIIREFLHNNGFVEIETPILAKSTPEGARDFLVPSRLHPGKFYSLAQSPQIYKQLLMVAGFDKYFQFARCFRDEDLRKDRQFEHTQLDIECAFVEEEDIFTLIESLLRYTLNKLFHIDIDTPFERITYKEAMEKYGSDKPDIRYGLELKALRLEKFKNECVKCIFIDRILTNKQIQEIMATHHERSDESLRLYYIKYADGKISGSLCKFIDEKEIITDKKEYTGFVAVGDKDKVCELLGIIRNLLIEKYLPKKEGYKFLWVTDFPMFTREKETGEIMPTHHIFVMPKNIDSDPEKMIGRLYDLVLNGVELGSGSIRVHERALQEKLMRIINIDGQKNFGCLLDALEYGAPPHGGIALGLDRLAAVLLNKNSIQDLIAFPKTTTGMGLLEEIPSEVDESQLKELHIECKK